jgi:hypothetical protein
MQYRLTQIKSLRTLFLPAEIAAARIRNFKCAQNVNSCCTAAKIVRQKIGQNTSMYANYSQEKKTVCSNPEYFGSPL